MYAKIKSAVGRIVPRQRYADPDEAQSPEETLDPEQWHHEAKPGLGQRLSAAKRTLAIWGALLVVVAGILTVYAREFVVGIVSNPAVRTAATHGLVGVLGFVVGVRSFRSRLREWDWLVLQLPDGTLPLLGSLDQGDDGTTIFTPYSGIDWLGFRARQLQLGELGSSTARTLAKQGRDMDSGARIRVDDAIAASRETAFGTVTAVMTAGLSVDPFGQHSDVYTEPPNTVDKQQYKQLRDRLEDYVEDEIPRLRAEATIKDQQIEDLRSRLRETGDEAIDQFIDRYRKVEEARGAEAGPEPLPPEDDTTPLQLGDDDDDPLLNGGGPT
jgi:hypothetical protein